MSGASRPRKEPLSGNFRASEIPMLFVKDRTLPYTIAVVLLPVLVLWHRADALFSPLWYTDPWFYLGYFKSLANYKHDLFFGSYYGSRLAWILPGFVVHSVLPPLVANVVLHLTVHLTATLSFFVILRAFAGVRTAFLATMIFSVDPWLWAATGWDYVDGAGIAYCLLAMALLTRAAMRVPRKGALLLAGVALAGMAYSHIFLATLTPLVLLYYFGLVWRGHGRPAIWPALASSAWIAAAFAGVTLALCGINYRLDGTFWFYAPSFKRASFMAKDFRFVSSIFRGHDLVPWLWPAVFGTVAAIVMLPTRWKIRKDPATWAGLLFSAQLLLAFGYLGYLQLRGNTILPFHPYVSYLLPFAFLLFGVSFWPTVEIMSGRQYVLMCGAAALALAGLWYEPNGYPILRSKTASDRLLAFSACILIAALIFRHRRFGPVLSVAGFITFTAVASSQTFLALGMNLHGTRHEYVQVMKARQHIEDRRAGAPILFWYDGQELPYLEYKALNSTYLAEINRISESFPQGCSEPAPAGTLVVITSQKMHSPELAQQALTECWRAFGIRPRLEAAEAIEGGGDSFTMTMLKAEPAPALPPPGELYRSISLAGVQVTHPQVVLRRVAEGLEIQTIPALGAFAVRASLGLQDGEGKQLAVVVRLRVLQGKVAVGLFNAQNGGNKMNRLVFPLPGAIDVVLPIPAPAAAGDVIISNARADQQASKFLLEKLEIRKLP